MRAATHSVDAPLLEIRLLGEPSVSVCGRDITRSVTKRAIWLLAILALREGKPIERQRLAGTLWPDSTDPGALHNLRQTLASLRTALGPAKSCIGTVTPRSLYIDSSTSVVVDVLEFDRACADGSPGALDRAISLYRERLLQGCDEPFAEAWREARENMFLEAADRLGAHFMLQQSYSLAARVFRRALAEDPYRETACRALMTCLSELGEGPAALELCREFRIRLRNDLGTEPGPETKALYKRIRAGTSASGRELVKGRMPIPLTGLVGRENEIGDLVGLLGRCRMVTMTGAGGVGKTRLALAVAEKIGNRYLDGAWFVDLAPIADAGVVPATIALALDIQEEAGRSILETIAERLMRREMLVVLDNCEHVDQAVAEVLERLLSAVWGLHVLATSRQSIGVQGEWVWRVPSLSTPAEDAQDISGSDSVRLFLERSYLDTDSPQDLRAIGSICRRLDGLPLAIELAAARTRVLSIEEIESRLDDAFGLLTGGGRTLARHQTLEASIEWSWNLLNDSEKTLLMVISAFGGGSTLDSIEAVAPSMEDGTPILDVMASLVDRSLVVVRRAKDGSRYSLLETIRQFADRRLTKSGRWELVHGRHRDHFLALAKEGHSKAHSPEEQYWFERFETEHDNLRAAVAWCHYRGEHEQALELVVALSRFWDTHGHLAEGREHFENALRHPTPGSSSHFRAGAHTLAGWIATMQHDSQGAIDHYLQSLPIFRELGDQMSVAKTLTCLGTAYQYAQRYPEAQDAWEEAVDLCRLLSLPGGVSMNLSNLAELALTQGDNERARKYLDESLGGPPIANPEAKGQILCVLSLADLRQGRHDEAEAHIREALRLFQGADVVVNIPAALEHMAIVEGSFQRWENAARLLGACEGLAAAKGAPLADLLASDHAELIELGRMATGVGRFDACREAGKGMTIGEAVDFALSC